MSADIGRGRGYRSESIPDDGGYWHSNGNVYGGGDKWSSIFSSSRSSHSPAQTSTRRNGSSTANANRATMGLSRLRFLLEERRSEDRIYDRQHRLRLQQSRIIEANGVAEWSRSNNGQTVSTNNTKNDRHEPGWLLSHGCSTMNHTGTEHNDCVVAGSNTNHTLQPTRTNSNGGYSNRTQIPSLQKLAAQTLGPLLPMYCAACGSDFVGASLKSVSASMISELSISLAIADWSSRNNGPGNHDGSAMFAMTDGALKSMVISGLATGLVLRGAPLPPLNDEGGIDEDDNDGNDDTRWLSDDGLLSLCPRISPMSGDEDPGCNHRTYSNEDDDSSHDHWETLDFDMGLKTAGCFHLKRLELIDIPLRRRGASAGSGGISLQALRSVLRSCSGITHFSLSGCFYNWEDTECSPVGESDDIGVFIGGNQSLSSLSRSIPILAKLRGNGKHVQDIIPTVLFHRESMNRNDEVLGLDTMLPELRVLDVSHCSWVTEDQIIQLLLKFWERALHPSTEVEDVSFNGNHWEDKGEQSGSDAFELANNNDGNGGQNEMYNWASTSCCRKQCKVKINTPLQYLNIRGTSGDTQWMKKWRGHGLFDGIEVSNDRHVRV